MKADHNFKIKSIPIFAMVLLILVFAGALSAKALVSDLDATAVKTLVAQHDGNPDFVILDIRTPAEYRQGHIAGAICIDYYSPQFKSQLARLDRGKTYLVYCRSGNRSNKALKIFNELGFEHIYHLSGGVIAWRAKGYDLVK